VKVPTRELAPNEDCRKIAVPRRSAAEILTEATYAYLATDSFTTQLPFTMSIVFHIGHAYTTIVADRSNAQDHGHKAVSPPSDEHGINVERAAKNGPEAHRICCSHRQSSRNNGGSCSMLTASCARPIRAIQEGYGAFRALYGEWLRLQGLPTQTVLHL
jgi:hypothetical protein